MTTIKTVTDRLIEHLRNNTTDLGESDIRVPISHYVSQERAAAERDLMRRMPLIVAHHSELPDPGCFITRDVLGTPLIIVRQSDGSVAAYVNMCKHRGGRVERSSCGVKEYFSCAYHGWTYAADGGSLVRVPYEDFFERVDHDRNGLTTVTAQERHGLIWVDLSGQSDRTIADYLGDELDDELSRYDFGHSEIYLDTTFPLDMNWKLVIDGAIDSLHPKFLHPTGVGKLLENQTNVWVSYGRHGRMYQPRKRMRDLLAPEASVENAWRYFGSNTVVYPNSLIIMAPDHVEFWTIWPSVTEPTKCVTHIRFLVRSEILDDRMRARLDKSFEILKQAALEEDWPMAQSIQDNAIACPDGEFLFGRNEQSSQHLHRQLARDLDGFEM